ncbi:transglutaminase family protein [Methylococcus sp. EFPC2]|uniref:transglutaminase family protein n=1 Tax=Methylococcus sp. EFPC2 TaxID=2812648 RepID=UPI001967AB33|nr:transglutaminase family protein [Methylococcus sp. EFPC2]QSA97755.1 transglutaminase family protein [Methylococcus sp. EFPC2]
MRRLQIKHVTTYQYAETVTLLPHKLLLHPREGHDVRIESNDLAIYPAHDLRWQRDVYDNTVAVATFTEPGNRLCIDSRIVLQHYDDRPLDFWVADHAVRYPFLYDPAEYADLCAYILPIYSPAEPLVNTWLQAFWQPGQGVETYVLLDRINRAIARDFTYRQRDEPGVQTPATTLAKRAGSCRDFAALFCESCHYLGLAARFVSGYQCSPLYARGLGATHAWSEVYLPGAGWKGFDSTNGQLVGNEHIVLAVGRHPESVPPVSGSFLAATRQSPVMQVVVEVAEIPDGIASAAEVDDLPRVQPV